MKHTSSAEERRAGEGYRVPFAVDVAGAWSWRLIVIAGAGWVVWKGLGHVSLLVIAMMVAMLLAALLSPTVMLLRKKGVRAGGAAAIAELGLLLLLAVIISLTGQQLVRGFATMANKAVQGYQQLVDWWLKSLGYDLGADQLNQLLHQIENTFKDNPNTVLNGVSRVGSTAADVATGVLLTLFTLLFFLMEGERIWLFVVGLFPKDAREAVNGAGRAGWKSLGAYVRVQILVAAIDAIGIGLGAAILGVPLAIPLGVLVFLGSFIPVIGALFSGAVAVLLALVALGPVQALIMLGIVLLVQQVESHILQPLIMGKAVSLHPLAVIFSVAGGSMIFGAVGALFAVPTLAVVNSVVRYLADRGWEHDPSLRDEEFLFPHEVARREHAEEKAQERQESVKKLASRVPRHQKAEEPENRASEVSDSSED
ncbi:MULTISPECIES: AI-2E family transporter [Rothia]|uniref:AI-2E family transporter n=1 Tax=Rothia TaxID=32207 RepID=UPI00066C920B|nr:MULTISPECIES: AI-2E family transporter [Rothia]OFM97038.1 AI-2E family transporter [Rothia sp. HMSC072B03]